MSVPDDPFGSLPSNVSPSPPNPNVTYPQPIRTSGYGSSLMTPANGTIPPGSNGGARTPRRVQWTPRVADPGHPALIRHSDHFSPRSDTTSLQESDLAHVTNELERHQSLSREERHKPRFMVGGDDYEEDVELTAGEEDYDYRLDTAGDGPQDYGRRESTQSSGATTTPGESDGHDRAGQMGDMEKQGQGYENEKIDVQNAGGEVHPTAALPIPEENHELPPDIRDEMHVFVDAGETDGLPSLPPGHEAGAHLPHNFGTADYMNAEASALVKAHKTGRFGNFLRNRKTGIAKVGQGVTQGVSTGVHGVASGVSGIAGTVTGANRRFGPPRETGGIHAMAMKSRPGTQSGSSAFTGGGGVLGSLLALYDTGQPTNSGTSTPTTSRPASLGPSDSDDSEEEREREKKWRKKREKEERLRREKEAKRAKKEYDAQQRKGAEKVRTPLAAFGQHPRRQHAISDPPAPQGDLAGTGDNSDLLTPNPAFSAEARSHSHSSLIGMSSPKLFQSVKRTADRLGLDVGGMERHKQARSGAGVFGALIQNTGHLSGVATPVGSTLVPNAKRPGYRLSRYSLQENTPAQDVSPQPRPISLYSRPDSPQSLTRVGTGESPSSQSKLVDGHIPLGRPVTMDSRPKPASIELPPRIKSGKAFSMKSFTDLTNLPLTPGSHFKHFISGTRSQAGTPPSEYGDRNSDYFSEKASKQMSEDDRKRKEWEGEKKRRKKAKEKKKQQEIFIIQHVAAILARQQFLMKLIRAFMMFGSPTHRLEAQIQATARVLELNCQVVSLPGTCLISFNDDTTHTSETKFLKQAGGLDLQKLLATHHLYWDVVHDTMSAEDASKQLDILMTSKPYYPIWAQLLIGGFCSSFICCVAFYGSFVDALISFPLGVLLIAIQIFAARNDLYSNVFEIAIATIQSFLAAALASSNYFCYTAVTSSAIVLILPGYIVLSGSLELASRNITSGSVRMAYSVIYSLFLGFGITIGAEIYRRITSLEVVGSEDYTCGTTHYAGAPWWLQTVPSLWYILIVPGYSFWLALRQSQPIWAKETPVMVLISCAGWSANHFSSLAFPNRADITSAIGAFVVGFLGNIWGRFFKGTSFVVMLVGVLFQLPSGLGNGGLFNFASDASEGSTATYSTGFQVAQQLVQVAIGLTVGLFLAAIVVHPFGGGRRRGGSGIFSF